MYFHFRHQIYIIASLLLNAPLISVLPTLSSVLCYSLILHRFCFKFQTVVNVKMDNGTFDLGDIEDIEIIDQTWDANNIIVKIKPKEEDHGSPIRKIDQAAQLNPIEYLEAKKCPRLLQCPRRLQCPCCLQSPRLLRGNRLLQSPRLTSTRSFRIQLM